ncbi:APC family permease [Bacteroidota bacterium]
MNESGLLRRLGFFPATNIVIANMIGAGIFTTSGLLMADLHSPVLMISLWMVGGLIALCGALSYGELGATMPEAGGEYMFLSNIFHPMLGFLSGWVSFIVGFSAPIAASAIGFSEYFLRAIPETSELLLINQQTLLKLLAIFIILSFTFIHYLGISVSGKVQNILTILKVALIVGLIVAGLASGKGDVSHFYSDKQVNPGFGGIKTIGLSLMWIMFAYSGWNASTYIGSEIKNPLKNLPSSLLAGTLIVVILYFMLNVIFVYAVPPDEMKGVISIGGLAMGKLFGLQTEKIISILISFALFSSLSAFIILGPRVYYSMAKDGLFFKAVANIHPTFKVPAFAIILQAIIAVVYVISGSFEQILTYMGFSLGIFPVLTIIGLIKLRKKGKVALKIPGYPYTQLIYIGTGIIILLLALLERPLESGIAILVALIGIPLYFLFKRIQ